MNQIGSRHSGETFGWALSFEKETQEEEEDEEEEDEEEDEEEEGEEEDTGKR